MAADRLAAGIVLQTGEFGVARDVVWEACPDGETAKLSASGWRYRVPYIFRRGRRHMVWGGLAVLLGVLIVLAALVAATLNAAEQRKRAQAWHVHSIDVLLVVSELNEDLNAALRGERGFLLTNDRAFLAPYEAARESVPESLARLRALTRDNARQHEMTALLVVKTNDFFKLVDFAVEKVRSGEQEEAIRLVRSGAGQDRSILVFDILREIESEEKRLLDERVERQRNAEQRSGVFRFAMIGFGFALLLLAAGVGLMALDGHVRTLDINLELGRIATTDALTSLSNRRSFLEEMQKVLVRSGRSGSPVSMAMFDIDHFKQVNDTHGHPAGDEVLKDVARIIRETVREGDVAARLGGEEFALLMPDTAISDAGAVCERVREAVEAYGFQLPSGVTISATISAGAAQAEVGDTPSALISRADALLYAAKREGRNRVCLNWQNAAELSPLV